MGASNSSFILLFATSSLLLGAAFVYIAVKAPFYWGGAFYPGVALLATFVVTALVGVASLLRKPSRDSS